MNSILQLEEILAVVPIREPVLCIDAITILSYGKVAAGYKNITKSESWARGHFIDEPIFPGTLIIETMLQIGSFIFYDIKNPKVLKAYLGKINNVKFFHKVIPDCRLYIDAEFVSKFGKIVEIKCDAKVDSTTVARGNLTLCFIEDFII